MINRENIIDSYKFYRRENPKIDPSVVTTQDDERVFLGIIYGFIDHMMEKVFDGWDVKLGAKLGIMGVRGMKIEPIINERGEIKGVAPDWGATKKLQASDPIAKEKRTIVYCFNEHSNGIKYQFFWGKRGSIVTHKTFYSLTFSRHNRRTLASGIKTKNKEYLIVPTKVKRKCRKYAKRSNDEKK